MSDKQKKQFNYAFIETGVFVLIWLIIFLFPLFTNRSSNGELIWTRIAVSWIKTGAFLLVFLLNIYVLIPLLLKKKQYERYVLIILAITPLIICFSLSIESRYSAGRITGMPPMELGPGMPPMELSDKMPAPAGFKLPQKSIESSNEMKFLQNLAIALLVIGTGTAYKVAFFWIEEEKQKKVLQQQVQKNNQHIDDYIYVKSDFKMIQIRISEILYIESANEYIKIYLEKGESITTFMRLKNMETKLPTNQFMRVQRSFIVNLKKIQAVEKNRIFIEQKKFIPIGEQYKENFQQYLGKNFIK
ncbi:MAG: LytTR family DNA-binding domain-containing protein [Paludibacter sp.]|nr:LytTR family DNA-binding domain-containing protein [Paludibacter sp.]MDD4427214.1 LytTR family DNA-binding domain-containing protein [Paludibacter sp.]